MALLPGPYEILDLEPGGSIDLKVLRWETGQMTIAPRDGRPPKEINVLRVHVPADTKETVPYYWDVTSQLLVAGWMPILDAGNYESKTFRITKLQHGLTARFSLQVL